MPDKTIISVGSVDTICVTDLVLLTCKKVMHKRGRCRDEPTLGSSWRAVSQGM